MAEPDYTQDPDHKVEVPTPTPEPEIFVDGRFDSAKASDIFEQTKNWPDAQRAAMLTRLRAAEVRAKVKTKYQHPAQIAATCDPNFVITPALELCSRAIERVLRSPKKINLLITMPPQEGKLVASSTPVPTPSGWRKHGELGPGDHVFHPDGRVIEVTARHPEAETQYRVHFSDHTAIEVHGAHEWTVYDRTQSKWRTMETVAMARRKIRSGPAGRGGRYVFQLPFREAVDLPDADLLIDPYTLGAWLGDGSSSKAALTHHPDDEYEFPYPRTARCVHKETGIITDYYGGDLRAELRALGLLNNKHVPRRYLRGSISQRRALLEGLIDTDGCITGAGTNQQVVFDNANEQLVRDVAELARSLGYRAHVHAPSAPCTSTSGIVGKQWMWRVGFSPHDMAPARLSRKVAAFRPALRRRVSIVAIEKLVIPGTGNCITVGSPDGLYCVGEGWTPTHNSTTAAVWTPIRALQLRPRPIILATYASALAEKHSREMRRIIDTHGANVTDTLTGLPVEDKLGLSLAHGANKVSSWSIDGGAGGLVAAGIGSAITGFQADLMIIDDPFKNMMEADSAAHRLQVDDWFSNVALTRLSPSASVILIQTRWHPEDLAGKIIAGERLLDGDERTWRHINIPAISEEGIPDALNRPLGEPMKSARDTPEAKRNFAMTRKQVGERTWYALYQGSPRNPAGGIFQRAWFEPRLEGVPAWPVASIVGVDPADSGEGDEAGVIGGMLLADGRVALTHDRSGHYTADQWSTVAVTLALEMGAREIAVEGYTAAETYATNVKKAYRKIHDEAVAKYRRGEQLTPIEQRALPDIAPFTVTKWRGPSKADAVARSGGLSQALETKKCRTVEFAMRVFEEQAADWQAGQHQPDRVAAAVITHDRLAELAGSKMTIANPAKVAQARAGAPRKPPQWMTRKIGKTA